jgi:hypothetical protein
LTNRGCTGAIIGTSLRLRENGGVTMRVSIRASLVFFAVAVICSVAVYAANNPGTLATGQPIRSDFDELQTIRGDGKGTYVDGQSLVKNQLLDNNEGNFVLDTNTGSKAPLRTVTLDFGNQLAGVSGPRPACGNYSACVKAIDTMLITRSAFFDGKDDLRSMTHSQTTPKRLLLTWYEGKVEYELLFDGQMGAAFVDFTCTGVTDGRCTSWMARPGDWLTRTRAGTTPDCPDGRYNCYSGSIENNRAALYYTANRSGTKTLITHVEMPFTITFSRP